MGIFDANGGLDATQPTEGLDNSSFQPIPPGNYSFIVDQASEEVSSKGNDMLKIVLSVADGDHQGRKVFDYITPGAHAFLVQKIKNLALSAGLQTLTCAEDLEGHKVRAKVKIKPASNGYEAGNSIGDYIPKTPGLEQQQAAPAPQAAAVPPRAAASTGWDS